MDKYIEMLQKIKENVHIERLLNESPTWIGTALAIAMTVLGAGFILMLATRMLGSRSTRSIGNFGCIYICYVHCTSGGTFDSDVGI